MGFININTGQPKYVFTQPLAPTGEGEIEGSLWYNTTANGLYTYTGLAWVPASTVNIKTGTYTGDGSLSQGITGIGFQPTYVHVFDSEAHGVATQLFFCHENIGAGLTTMAYSGTVNTANDRIISLDLDGFTVDDQGANGHPNKNAQVYLYLAVRSG